MLYHFVGRPASGSADPICLSVRPSVSQSVCPSVRPSVRLIFYDLVCRIELQQQRSGSGLVLYHFVGRPASGSADPIAMIRRLTEKVNSVILRICLFKTLVILNVHILTKNKTQASFWYV